MFLQMISVIVEFIKKDLFEIEAWAKRLCLFACVGWSDCARPEFLPIYLSFSLLFPRTWSLLLFPEDFGSFSLFLNSGKGFVFYQTKHQQNPTKRKNLLIKSF